MPEIAEVRTVARTLNKSLPGNKIKDINVIYDPIIDQDINEFKNILIGKLSSIPDSELLQFMNKRRKCM